MPFTMMIVVPVMMNIKEEMSMAAVIEPTVCVEGHDKLVEAYKLFRHKQYKEADKLVDELYEDYSRCRVWLNAEDSHYMFVLINALCDKLYK